MLLPWGKNPVPGAFFPGRGLFSFFADCLELTRGLVMPPAAPFSWPAKKRGEKKRLGLRPQTRGVFGRAAYGYREPPSDESRYQRATNPNAVLRCGGPNLIDPFICYQPHPNGCKQGRSVYFSFSFRKCKPLPSKRVRGRHPHNVWLKTFERRNG